MPRQQAIHSCYRRIVIPKFMLNKTLELIYNAERTEIRAAAMRGFDADLCAPEDTDDRREMLFRADLDSWKV